MVTYISECFQQNQNYGYISELVTYLIAFRTETMDL
jgi:hypothetical protein